MLKFWNSNYVAFLLNIPSIALIKMILSAVGNLDLFLQLIKIFLTSASLREQMSLEGEIIYFKGSIL